jgi:hypothetical protein
LNANAMWTTICDRTLGLVRPVITTGVLASLSPVAEHTRALVAYMVVLGSPLTHSSLIVFIRLSE